MCLAVPGRIISLNEEGTLWRSGRVDFGGVIKEVNLSCVTEAQIGHYVIVHAGVAISQLDEEEAARILGYLRAMAEGVAAEEAGL